MKKTAFIFPGQGAQYVGMAQDFIEADPANLEILLNFDKDHQTNLVSIMKEGPESLLQETKFTQPAILFHSYVALNAFQKFFDVKPNFVAGHSLGEFSALVANNVLSVKDALHLVHKRGQFMIQANDGTPYAMAAIIGPDSATVKQYCNKASDVGVVIAANFNTPVQTVISGSKKGVDRACELAKADGVKRIIPLKVGGPFHSPLIEQAGIWLQKEMENIQFQYTDIPVISNVDAKPAFEPKKIKNNLSKQVTSSVLWVDSINFMINEGVELFFEFGPKKVLAGMIKKINRKVKVFSIDTLDNLNDLKESLELK